MTRLNKFIKMTTKDRRLYIKAVFMLIVVQIGLHGVGYARLVKWLENHTFTPFEHKNADQSKTKAEAYQRALHISQIVDLSARQGVYNANCLRRAITKWWLLRRENLNPVIRFGAKRPVNKLQAHAWVELDGQPVGEGLEVLASFPMFHSKPSDNESDA